MGASQFWAPARVSSSAPAPSARPVLSDQLGILCGGRTRAPATPACSRATLRRRLRAPGDALLRSGFSLFSLPRLRSGSFALRRFPVGSPVFSSALLNVLRPVVFLGLDCFGRSWRNTPWCSFLAQMDKRCCRGRVCLFSVADHRAFRSHFFVNGEGFFFFFKSFGSVSQLSGNFVLHAGQRVKAHGGSPKRGGAKGVPGAV